MAKRPPMRYSGYQHPAMNYQKPKGLKRVQLAVSVLASVALAFGLWSFAWYAASAWVKVEIANWVDLQRSRGAVVDYRDIKTGGFPSTIAVTLTDPKYAGPLGGHAVRWNSDRVKVMAKPWSPWRLNVTAPGKHHLSLDGGALSWTGEAEKLVVQTVLGDVWPESLDLDVQNLVLHGSTDLTAAHLRLQATHDPNAQLGGTGLGLTINAKELDVPGLLPAPLGPRISVLDVGARLTGPVVPGPAERLVPHWQASGGVLELDRFKFRSGPVGVATGGTISLDKDLQPIGALTAKIEGLFQMLEILRAKKVMTDGQMVMATMALSALSKRPKDGGAPQINISVTVQDGMLSLGPLKVMKMPKLDWGFPKPKPEPVGSSEPEKAQVR